MGIETIKGGMSVDIRWGYNEIWWDITWYNQPYMGMWGCSKVAWIPPKIHRTNCNRTRDFWGTLFSDKPLWDAAIYRIRITASLFWLPSCRHANWWKMDWHVTSKTILFEYAKTVMSIHFPLCQTWSSQTVLTMKFEINNPLRQIQIPFNYYQTNHRCCQQSSSQVFRSASLASP